MTSSSAAAAIPSASSSTLSPHAAPFALPACSVRTPLQDGEVSRSMDGSIVVHEEDTISGDTRLGSYFQMKSCETALPSSTAYPSSICSTSAVFSYPSVTMTSNHNQKIPLYSGMGSNGRKCSTVKIERPPNKTPDTISRGLASNSSITKDVTKPNKDTVKKASFPQSLEVDRNGMPQDTMICSKEASPVSHMRPLRISSTGTDPCDSVADGVKPDPLECSVDSPCWKGASVSHLSSFDVLQTPALQLINQESEALGAEQKESTSIVLPYDVLTAPQNLDTIGNKQNQPQSHVQLSVPINSGDIGKNQTKVSHKGLESAHQCAAKCTAEQKHSLELRDSVKRSGLNFAAPDFIPSSAGKSKNSKGSCSTTGRNTFGILKEMKNLSEMLRDSYFLDGIGPDEHEYTLLQSLIENLQTCLHKERKGLIKDGASNKAGLNAHHSESTVLKSDAGNYKGSCTINGGKGITINKSVGPSHLLNDFGKNSLTWSQPSSNNFPRMISCEEEHSQILIYKNLWIEAEHTNCELKYLLKQTRLKIGEESSVAHVGGPRIPSSQACDFGAGPSNSYGAAISYPPTLSFPKVDHAEETSKARNTLYTGDCIQLSDNRALSCSASTSSHSIQPKNFQGDLLTGLEDTVLNHHVQPVLQFAPSRAHRDEVSARSCFTGVDSFLHGNSEYDSSSDWEHVLKEEIGWS
uniref:Uncharacterized protein n=1 Tax=Leersia perrieri TaxID=77586 RepID=A0A0D9X4L8_9ORYZ